MQRSVDLLPRKGDYTRFDIKDLKAKRGGYLQVTPEVDNVVRDIMSSSEYIVNKLVKDMKKLTIFRDTLKDIMDQTDEETRDRPNVKQKDIVSSFVPQHEESSVNVWVSSGIRKKGSGSHKRFKSKCEQAISRMGKRARGCHSCGQSGHDRRTCPALRGTHKDD
ncbi:hypothetical protein E3N88_32561 [Mikania micrantha]|uniref:CCHC-type domain-containing protein n=1 Tax=Mikania micrantha TaxID=192012 RepID=A0A5N6MA36_9ASTR|nr:hypothetical protein E3N88_32561 [Mikania micrantha]